MKKNYTSVHVWSIITFVTSGAVIGIASAILGFSFGAGAGIALTFVGVFLVFTSKDDPTPEPTLFRYEVDMDRSKSATIYAASVHLDDHNFDTYIFEDHDGSIIAIYSNASRVVARKVMSEED